MYYMYVYACVHVIVARKINRKNHRGISADKLVFAKSFCQKFSRTALTCFIAHSEARTANNGRWNLFDLFVHTFLHGKIHYNNPHPIPSFPPTPWLLFILTFMYENYRSRSAVKDYSFLSVYKGIVRT